MDYFQDQDCAVCNQHNNKVIYSNLIHTCHVLSKAAIPLENSQIPTDIMECSNCGHRYLAKILNSERLNFYYNVVETEYFDGQKLNPSDHRPAETQKFAEYINSNAAGKKVLEIGCGLGFLLYRLKALGKECYGVEPSAFASGFAREKLSLNVETGLLDEYTYANQKFDTIVLSDVVEHVPGINTLFKVIEKYLKPGGKVIVFTGDSKSKYAMICGVKWLYFYSWEHLSFFNKNSIKYLFDKHALYLEKFDRVAHTGSYLQNSKIFIKTIGHFIFNILKIRKDQFYSMAFDHFIAIGTKTTK